jgi:porin
MNRFVYITLITLFLLSAANAVTTKPPTTAPAPKPESTSPITTSSISSNPAAVNVGEGTGALQRYLEKKWGIQDNHGIAFQGAWLGDTNQLFSGGIPNAKRNTLNSVLLLELTIDTEKLYGWKGGLFGAQFLQQNAQNTNGQAGVVQGYNSLPDVPPFNRSELYDLWYRQEFFDKKLYVRVGKTVTTLEFNNVIKPDVLAQGEPNIPAVTSLIYTPIFINTAVDGIMPGYTNSAYGVTISFTPVKQWYLKYGVYDGNLASGKQTGLTGPTFNGSYFHIGETGSAWLIGKNHLPGNVGVGVWRQTGLIRQSILTEEGASGAYIFGSQRLWYRYPGYNISGVSAFYQYGINNSSVLPMKQFVGGGLTAFSLIPNRPNDSMGIGTALSWLNQRSFVRKTELMYQIYYQAKVIPNVYLEPALSYIPKPGTNPNLNAAWAGTVRAIVLF